MTALSILPVKELKKAKSRLSHLLNDKERAGLTLGLLDHTLRVIKSCTSISRILIVSKDLEIRTFAKREEVLFLEEEGCGLNRALNQATRWALEKSFSEILILPIDVPFLETQDLEGLIALGKNEREIVVISPDQTGKGTNALFTKPPGIMEYCFGNKSFQRHIECLLKKKIAFRIYNSPRISFDLDSPDDYFSMHGGNLGR